jgi:hypothetical protein
VVRNPNPEKCNTETGVTFLISDIWIITIVKGSVKITCWGSYTTGFESGVTGLTTKLNQ